MSDWEWELLWDNWWVPMFVLIVFISWIDANCIRRNDFHRVELLISAMFQILDSISDILLVLIIVYYIETTLLFVLVAVIFFIITSSIMSVIQLKQMINKHWKKSEEMRSWLSKWSCMLYIISLLFGSFFGIHLCRSNLFGLALFDMPPAEKDAIDFEIKKLYSVTIFKVWMFIFNTYYVCLCSFLKIIKITECPSNHCWSLSLFLPTTT